MAIQKVGWRSFVPSQTSSSSYLLDAYSGAAAAYSLRKLSSTYTGSAIRVRRSSDNTETNIGFSNGNLDVVTLLSFVGTGNGFVTTWYDQSGNSRNLTQTTAANQPSIILSGTLNNQNGKPILITDYNSYMINGSVPINGVTNSIFALIKLTSTRGNIAILSGYGNDNQHFVSRNSFGNNRYYDSNGQEIYAPVLPNGLNLINLHENTNGITVYENNSNLVNNFTHSTNNTTGIVIFRRDVSDGLYMSNGSGYSELIVYGNSSQLVNNSGISSNINSYYSIYATDTDAQAFVSAASITDGTQINAVNTLVTDLKTAGIWTKMKAIYPFVGGSAASHKWNLKDPRDLDAAYRLTFTGGWTHNSSGALSNGSNAYANMNVNANQIFSSTNGLLGFYTPSTTTTGGGYIYGVSNMADSEWGLYRGATTTSFGMYRSYTVTSTSTTPGLHAVGMDSNGWRSVYKNGSRDATQNYGFIAMPQNLKMYLAARNANGNADGHTGFMTSFGFFSDTLTLSENSAFYTAVQKFQTALGRQVGTPVGNNSIVTDGLVANLDAGNPASYPGTGTTWTDLSGNGKNGTLLNGVAYSADNSGSLVFDGVNDYVDLGSSFKFNDSDLTYDFWVKVTDNSDVYHEMMTLGSYDGANHIGLWKYRSGNNAGKVIASINVVGFNQTIVTSQLTGADILNIIVNYTAIFKKESGVYKVYLYRNGVLDNTGTTNITSYNMNNWTNFEARIGSGSTTYPELWKGNIYSGRVYNRALSQLEVLQNYNATKSRFGL